MSNKRNRDIDLQTNSNDKDKKPTSDVTLIWWATKKLQIALQRGTNLYKDTNPGPWILGVIAEMTMNTDERTCRDKGEQGRMKWGIDRRGWSHVKWGWSVHFSDQALYLMTSVCPVFILNPSLTISLCNFILHPVFVSTGRNKCQLLVCRCA